MSETVVRTTNTGRPKTPKIDRASIERAAIAEVQTTLNSIEDSFARLEKAQAIVDDANAIIDDEFEGDARMNKLGLSLALLEGARAVYDTMGISRSMFYNMTSQVLGDPTEVEVRHRDGSTSVETKYVWAERPTGWTEAVAARARARGIRNEPTAYDELPRVAEKVIRAKAWRDTALEVRDRLIHDLHAAGVTQQEIADRIGRDRSRISHLLKAMSA